MLNLHDLYSEQKRNNNIVREDILRLFYNAQKMIIYSTKYDRSQEYSLSSALIGKRKNGFRVVTRATRFQWEQSKPTWLKNAYAEMEQSANEAFINISLTETSDHEGIKVDFLTVQYNNN